jgi:hypothetical protein
MDLLLTVAGRHTGHLAITRRRRRPRAADPGRGRRIRVRVGGRQESVVSTEGRRFTLDDNGASERSSAATDRVREEQRVRRRTSGRVPRLLRSEPRPTGLSSRSEDRSERAPRHIGRIISAPPGSQCVTRRQCNCVPQAGALTGRPDVDRELPVIATRFVIGFKADRPCRYMKCSRNSKHGSVACVASFFGDQQLVASGHLRVRGVLDLAPVLVPSALLAAARELAHDALKVVRTRDLEEVRPAALDVVHVQQPCRH